MRLQDVLIRSLKFNLFCKGKRKRLLEDGSDAPFTVTEARRWFEHDKVVAYCENPTFFNNLEM